MAQKIRRCWTLKGLGIILDVPRKRIEESKELFISKLSPGSGIGIFSGECNVYRKTSSSLLDLGRFSQGDAIGVMSEESSSRAVTLLLARSPVEIFPLKWEMAVEEVKKLPPLKFFIKTVFKKAEMEINRTDFLLPSPIKRIARLFYLLSDLNPLKPAKGSVEISMEISNISRILALTETETALSMGHLVSEGVVEIFPEGFRVMSEGKLMKYADVK